MTAVAPVAVMRRRPARRVAAAAAIALTLATAAVPLVAGDAPAGAQLACGAAALAAMLVALTGVLDAALVFAGSALAGEYALRLPHRHGIDALALVEAILLFATVEAGLLSLDARSIARPEAVVRRYAAARAAVVLLVAAFAAFVVLALGDRPAPAPTAGLALGLAAVALLLAAAERLRRRATSRS